MHKCWLCWWSDSIPIWISSSVVRISDRRAPGPRRPFSQAARHARSKRRFALSGPHVAEIIPPADSTTRVVIWRLCCIASSLPLAAAAGATTYFGRTTECGVAVRSPPRRSIRHPLARCTRRRTRIGTISPTDGRTDGRIMIDGPTFAIDCFSRAAVPFIRSSFIGACTIHK